MRIELKTSSAKAKGRQLQQWVAAKIGEMLDLPVGKDEMIASREMAQAGTDVRLIGEAKERFPFAVECKRQESWSIPSWIRQAQSNMSAGMDWLLVCRKSREKAIVVMDAEAFFKIYTELVDYRENKK